MPLAASPRDERMATDCVILTALPTELEAVQRQFRRFRAMSGGARSVHEWYETTAPNGLSVVASAQTVMGNLAAASLTQEAIAKFNPKAILLVGLPAGWIETYPLAMS